MRIVKEFMHPSGQCILVVFGRGGRILHWEKSWHLNEEWPDTLLRNEHGPAAETAELPKTEH